MDKIKARHIFEQVKGTKIKDISIEEIINNGKSAAVFRGKKDGKLFAIKIFDNDIVERFGSELQKQRIERELSIKKHNIPNIVKVFDGDCIQINGIKYFYLIMEYIQGTNLKEYIENNTISTDFIVKVMNVLIDTTEALFKETPPLVHRDIKPENIMVTDNGEIILMDLGVLKIVNTPSMTDVGEKQFLGTLRYAPPEFLIREENDSINGWRAINIYQIGAVLHDMIMKKALFTGTGPYPVLVMAIKEDMPQIISTEYHPDLIQLAREMLHKDWKERLKLASIDKVKAVLEKCLLPQDEPMNYYNKIKTKALPVQNEIKRLDDIARSKEEKEKIMRKIHNDIWDVIEKIFIENKNLIGMMNKIDSSKVFSMENSEHTLPIVNFKFYQLLGKLEYGFSRPFFLFFMVENNANSYARIYILGIIPNIITRERILEPEKLVYELFSKEHKYPVPHEMITNPPEIYAEFTCFFDGIVEFGDDSLKKIVDSKIGQLLNKITEEMVQEVKEELEQQKERLESDKKFFVTIKTAPGIIFVN
jgi:serine/threonine protein kinase